MSNHSTSHTYQFCQLANGRPGWTARDQYKRGQFSKLCPFPAHYMRSTHQQRNNQLRHIKKVEQKYESPATMPHGLGTPQLSRGNAASGTRPAPTPAATSQSQPRIQAAHPRLRPTGCLFTRQQPCYTTANTTGEKPVAYTKLNMAF